MTRLHLPPIAGLTIAKGLAPAADARGRPCAVAVLTYPAPDADRDYVRPDGGDWTSRFPSNPVVNWDHGQPVGSGTVAVVPVTVRGVPTPLPVGTTHFFQTAADAGRVDLTEYATRPDGTRTAVGRFAADDCVRLAADVHRLVREDAASGVSIEFERTGAEGHDWWPTGATSPVSRRRCRSPHRW